MTADGKPVEIPRDAVTLSIAEDAWLEQRASGDTLMTFNVNPKKDPKEIDLSANGITLHGAYKLEGDLLTCSLPIPIGGKLSARRPREFVTHPGDPFAVFVYRRVGDTTALEPLAWESDWNTAFAKAKEQNQLVFVDFFATWCGPCQLMDRMVFRLPDVRRRMADFVLLRIDVDRDRKLAAGNAINVYPTYVVFDPGQRQRFRFLGFRPAEKFRVTLDDMRRHANEMLRASDLVDQGKHVDAQLLIGNTYTSMGMYDPARDAYREAHERAEKAGQKKAAQLADGLTAFTFAREGNPKRALKLLEKLTAEPADDETGALLWLTTGHTQKLANNPAAARAAYERALSLASPGSRVGSEAKAAIAELQTSTATPQ